MREKFVLALDLTGITLVLHDFGGPVGMGLAARHPERIRRIVSANGPAAFGQDDLLDRLIANGRVSPWFQWILKAQDEGRLETVLGQLGYNILSTLKLNGFENNSIITPTWIEAYGAPFAEPADCLGAIGWAKGYATGQHRFEQPDALTRRAIGARPALAIWGDADRTLQADHFLPLFADTFPGRNLSGACPVSDIIASKTPQTNWPTLISRFIRETGLSAYCRLALNLVKFRAGVTAAFLRLAPRRFDRR